MRGFTRISPTPPILNKLSQLRGQKMNFLREHAKKVQYSGTGESRGKSEELNSRRVAALPVSGGRRGTRNLAFEIGGLRATLPSRDTTKHPLDSRFTALEI